LIEQLADELLLGAGKLAGSNWRSKLKADKGKLMVTGEEGGDQPTLLSAATARIAYECSRSFSI